jgi:hypothetical protein
MHRAEHRAEDIAIKAGKAHSLLVDSVFPCAFGRFLSFLSLGSRLPFWCGGLNLPAISQMDHWVEVKHRYRHSMLLGDLGADRPGALAPKRAQ